MSRAITGSLAVAAFAAMGLAAFADPSTLLPRPMEGWTAASPVYGESLIEEGKPGTSAPESAVPPKRVEISRDYSHESGGLRISLNTYDRRGVQLIAYVNEVRKADPDTAAGLAARGILPFSFKSWTGVTMTAGEEGQVTGAALMLGEAGTLTLEGMADGKPGTVELDHVKAYLARIDIDRMADFVRETNATQAAPPEVAE